MGALACFALDFILRNRGNTARCWRPLVGAAAVLALASLPLDAAFLREVHLHAHPGISVANTALFGVYNLYCALVSEPVTLGLGVSPRLRWWNLLDSHISAISNQTLIGLALFLFSIWAAWEVAGKIVAGEMNTLAFVALGSAACAAVVAILRNWRSGFYLFLSWLLFEDMARKYMGNGTALFFGKDILAALVYISFFIALRRGREKTFRPPFLFFFSLFLWLGTIEIFNSNSPHVLYGLLGFKLYFYYFPLIFVGYALIRTDEDLRKFLVTNAVVAILIGGLGIAQAILGNRFLNPEHLAPELQDLGDLYKVTPISGQLLSLPDSVFVSSGRFAQYLTLASILMLGGAGYLFLGSPRGRKLVLLALGIVGGATLFSGSRGAVVYVAASVLALTVGFLWGAPWRWRQAHRMVRAIRLSFIVGALALTAILLIFPKEAGSRMAFYTETLSPNSSASELQSRSWDYPVKNFLLAFTNANWVLGNGTGTASLGTQYVAKMIGQRPPNIWVEEGYGQLIIEMGILAPLLWILWTAALLYHSWQVVRRLRQTPLFPIAIAIFWYAFLLLYPLTYGGLPSYQNYISNAYLWLLIGVLFRLPTLLAAPAGPAAVSAHPPVTRGGFQF